MGPSREQVGPVEAAFSLELRFVFLLFTTTAPVIAETKRKTTATKLRISTNPRLKSLYILGIEYNLIQRGLGCNHIYKFSIGDFLSTSTKFASKCFMRYDQGHNNKQIS